MYIKKSIAYPHSNRSMCSVIEVYDLWCDTVRKCQLLLNNNSQLGNSNLLQTCTLVLQDTLWRSQLLIFEKEGNEMKHHLGVELCFIYISDVVDLWKFFNLVNIIFTRVNTRLEYVGYLNCKNWLNFPIPSKISRCVLQTVIRWHSSYFIYIVLQSSSKKQSTQNILIHYNMFIVN